MFARCRSHVVHHALHRQADEALHEAFPRRERSAAAAIFTPIPCMSNSRMIPDGFRQYRATSDASRCPAPRASQGPSPSIWARGANHGITSTLPPARREGRVRAGGGVALQNHGDILVVGHHSFIMRSIESRRCSGVGLNPPRSGAGGTAPGATSESPYKFGQTCTCHSSLSVGVEHFSLLTVRHHARTILSFSSFGQTFA